MYTHARCIPPEKLDISKEVVGRGAFATVFKAVFAGELTEVCPSSKDDSMVEVAVKIHRMHSDEGSR